MKLLSWDVGKINPQKLPNLKGTMSLQAGASKPDENPTINLQFKIQQLAISGMWAESSATLRFFKLTHFLLKHFSLS